MPYDIKFVCRVILIYCETWLDMINDAAIAGLQQPAGMSMYGIREFMG